MAYIFQTLAKIISLYTILCFIRIFLTWIPGLNFSPIGQFISTLCDPYMNLFSRLPLHFGGLDFSPMISLGLLSVLSSIFKNISITGNLVIGSILANLLVLVWSVFETLFAILILILIIRLLVMIFSHKSNYYGSIWTNIDNSLSRVVYTLSKWLSFGKPISYKTALIFALLTSLIILFGGHILITILINLCSYIPF